MTKYVVNNSSIDTIMGWIKGGKSQYLKSKDHLFGILVKSET
jgi:hypothetical protein